MQPNQQTLVHPTPNSAKGEPAYVVTSSAPLEQKKKLKLPTNYNLQNGGNVAGNSTFSQNSSNNIPININNGGNLQLNSAQIQNAYQQNGINTYPNQGGQNLQFIIPNQPAPIVQSGIQSPSTYPVPQQQGQHQPYQQNINTYQAYQQPLQQTQFPLQPQHTDYSRTPYQQQNPGGYSKQQNPKKNPSSNITTSNNSQTPQNTPSVQRQDFFLFSELGKLSENLTVNQPTPAQQPPFINPPNYPHPSNNNISSINNNANNINNNNMTNYGDQGNKMLHQNNISNRSTTQRLSNTPIYTPQEDLQVNQQYEEQKRREKQQQEAEAAAAAAAVAALAIKKRQEEEEAERKRIEFERQQEEERKRKAEEEERIRQEEEERKRKEAEEAEELRRIEEQKLEQERQAVLFEERKRPVFEKISYYITSILNQTIKITYEESDNPDEEFLKQQIDKFEERKLTENTEEKKLPPKTAYNPGKAKMDRSTNQPTSSSNYRQNQNNNSNNNNNMNNNSGNSMQRKELDHETKVYLETFAKTGDWISAQKKEVDEKKQKQKDIKRLTNILTLDNIHKLRNEFLAYAQDNSILQEVIAAIMEKAITEIKYTALYGQICKFLNDEIKKTSDKEFKNAFISQIQQKFDNIAQVLKVKPNRTLDQMTPEERIDFHGQRKKRIILLVKFIGELFILGVINKNVIKIVISELMVKFFKYKDIQKLVETDDNYIHYDDCLQGIIELYEITGPSLDSKKEKAVDAKVIDEMKKQIIETKTIGQELYDRIENLTFQDMMTLLETYKNHGDVSYRIKALLQNLIERRDKLWEERLFQKEKPKTLQEIKQEHERDLQQRAEEVENFINAGGKYLLHNYKQPPQPATRKPAQRQFTGTTYQQKPPENEEVDIEYKESQKKNSNNTYSLLFGSTPVEKAPSQVKAPIEHLVDYESKVKEIYHKIDKADEVEESKKEMYSLIQENKKKVLTYLVSMCYTEKKEQNMIRTSFLIDLIKEQKFTIEDVTEILNSIFGTAQKEACDYPDVYKCLSLIIEALLELSPKFNLQNLKIELTGDEDDDFDVLYFFEELFNELFKSLKEKGTPMDPLKASLTKAFQNANLNEEQISNQINKFF